MLHQRILRLGQNLDQRFGIQIFQSGNHRQTPDKFGDQPELEQILRLAALQDRTRAPVIWPRDMRAETDALALQPVADDLFKATEGPATDEQDVRRVNL